MTDSFNIAVFISGTGSNLDAIIKKQQQYNYRVKLVISNNKNAKGLAYARSDDIETYTFDWDKDDQQLKHIEQQVKKHNCQLLVLAGFMKILPEPFIQTFHHQIINIHPSLLPKYPGLHTHQRALDNKDKTHGATVHFVNAELDAGTIISRTTVVIDQQDDAKKLAQKLLFREHSLLPRTISLFSQHRLSWRNNELFIDDARLTQPLQFND